MMCGLGWPSRGLFRQGKDVDGDAPIDPVAARMTRILNNSFKERSEDDIQRLLQRNADEAFRFDTPQNWTKPVSFNYPADGERILEGFAGSVAIYCAKGHRRPEMQDAHHVGLLRIQVKGERCLVPCFAVFDGHGGHKVAEYLADNLDAELLEAMQERCLDGFTDKGLWDAFKQACLSINAKICDLHSSGSTAIVCLIIENVLWTLNVGDSRAILADNAGYIGLSRDQKIAHCTSIASKRLKNLGAATQRLEDATGAERDFMRITKRGGKIKEGYVRGNPAQYVHGINMPRAFGNKFIAVGATRVISAKPEITRLPLAPTPSQILVLGCDGVWDCIGSEQAAAEIQAIRASTPSLVKTCWTFGRQIANSPVQNDNVTIMMVQLGSLQK